MLRAARRRERKQPHGDYLGLLEIQSEGNESFEEEMKQAFKKGCYTKDKKCLKRELDPKKVIEIIAEIMNIKSPSIRHIKYAKKLHQIYKSIVAICLRIYCDMSLSEMTIEFRGHTSSAIGRYSRDGYELLSKDLSLLEEIDKALLA